VFKKIKKFPSVWEKMSENRRGNFLTHTVVVESVTVCTVQVWYWSSW